MLAPNGTNICTMAKASQIWQSKVDSKGHLGHDRCLVIYTVTVVKDIGEGLARLSAETLGDPYAKRTPLPSVPD